MKTKVYVNRHIIKSNHKHDEYEPPLSAKTYKELKKGHEVQIFGHCRVIYRPDNPLSCGARVWIETEGEVIVLSRGKEV